MSVTLQLACRSSPRTGVSQRPTLEQVCSGLFPRSLAKCNRTDHSAPPTLPARGGAPQAATASGKMQCFIYGDCSEIAGPRAKPGGFSAKCRDIPATKGKPRRPRLQYCRLDIGRVAPCLFQPWPMALGPNYLQRSQNKLGSGMAFGADTNREPSGREQRQDSAKHVQPISMSKVTDYLDPITKHTPPRSSPPEARPSRSRPHASVPRPSWRPGRTR